MRDKLTDDDKPGNCPAEWFETGQDTIYYEHAGSVHKLLQSTTDW